MSKSAGVRVDARQPGVAGTVARPLYYVSNRPEAYEVAGEVGHDEAIAIAQAIVQHASQRFPGVEFRIDGEWHSHQPGMEKVAAYIEDHWEQWIGHIPL